MRILLIDNAGDWYRNHYGKTTTEIFSHWLGSTFSITTIPVAEFTSIPTQTEAIILSGSPANITDAFNDVHADTYPAHLDTTHRETYYQNKAVIQQAISQRIPLLGVCYGHQALAHYFGGTVERLNTKIPLSQVKTLMSGTAISTVQPAAHGDYVAQLPSNSHLLFEHETGLVYGAIYSMHPISVWYSIPPRVNGPNTRLTRLIESTSQ